MAMQPRAILCTVLTSLALVALACAPVAPTPTSTPASPANVQTKTAPGSTSRPSASPSPSASRNERSASADGKLELDNLVSAAKKEGKVVISGINITSQRLAAMRFQEAFPEIEVQYTGMTGRESIPRILAERQADQYLWDIWYSGPSFAIEQLVPINAFDPLRPALILPEVLDDKAWHQSFDDGWLDADRRYVYGFLGFLSFVGLVNRDITPKSELSSLDQLLDPKWKGKIAWVDPRRASTAQYDAATLLPVKGEAWYRNLLANDIVYLPEDRMVLESVHRGTYAVAMGTSTATVHDLQREGLLARAEYLEPDTSAGARMTSGSGSIAIFNKAPHPNAAKLFANWALSKDGVDGYVRAAQLNSRRLDVQQISDQMPRPGIQYENFSKQEASRWLERGFEIAKEYMK